MMDYFKSRGDIPEFHLDSYCNLKLVYGSIDKRGKVWIVEIPNNNLTEYLDVKIKETSSARKVLVEGNLRKWKYGKKSAVNDLNYKSYCECINLIAKRLGVAPGFILNLELEKIEIGGNIKLQKDYERFIPALLSYPELDLEKWCASSVYFKGSKYRLIFYDKLIEMRDRRIISAKVANRLREHIFILRFEIKIQAKSGYKKKELIQTFLSIKNNWNEIVEDWNSTFRKVKIRDSFSDARIVRKNSLTPRETKKYGNFLWINEIGVDRALHYFQYFVNNRKSEMVSYIQELYSIYTDGEKWHFYKDILSEVDKKRIKMLR